MANSDELAKLRIDKGGAGLPAHRRRHPARWIAALSGTAVVLLIAWRWLLNPVFTVAATTVTLVYPAQTLTVLNASGYVVAQRKAAVASKGTGRLIWLGVEEGSVVKKGQVIARLESDDLRAEAEQAGAARETAAANRDAARASRENAAAAREVARARVEEARAELDDAVLAFERQKKLLNAGVTTRAEFDVAEARQRRAAAAVTAAERSVTAAEHTVQAAQSSASAAEHSVTAAAASARAARVNVGYTEIRAPFDGVVLTKNADVGDLVTPISSAASARAAVVTMADLGSLQVEADVSEVNLQKVKAGQPCEVQLDALPDTRFPAVVHMIVPTADRAKGTVLAKVRFLSRDPRVLPEMSAKVAFLERPPMPGEEKPRTAVSPTAVVSRGAVRAVFRLEGDHAVEVPVVLGGPLGDAVEVKSGLQPGQKVVQSPPAKLRSGARVKVAEG